MVSDTCFVLHCELREGEGETERERKEREIKTSAMHGTNSLKIETIFDVAWVNSESNP